MKDNTRIAIGYICVALVIISCLVGGAWILSPTEFKIKFEADNNTVKIINKSLEMQKIKECYAITHEVWAVWDVRNNIIYNRTRDLGFSYELIECPLYNYGGKNE